MTAPATRRRQSIEHTEQTKFVMRVRAFHPDVLCISIPNGANVTASQRIRLTHEGMMPGAPDLLMVAAGLPPLAIEMKTDSGVTSRAQNDCHTALKQRGVCVAICRSSNAAYDAMLKWLGDTDK